MKNLPTRRSFIATGASSLVATRFTSAAPSGRPRIKIGQIGTTHAHALGKLDTIRKFSDVYDLVGVVEPDASRRRELQNRYPDLVWLDEDDLLSTDGLQAVAVETKVEELVPTGTRCLQAGHHIHLDKPAGESWEACRELHAEATARKLTVQMGYMFRYNPGFEFLFQVVRKGWLGEITEVSGMIGKKMGDAGRQELARFKGGGMFELGCHLVDALVTVLGKPAEVISVAHHTYPERDQFADNQLAVFDYPKAIGTIRCNHIDPLGGPRRTFSVTGTQGTCTILPLEPAAVRLGLDRDRGPYRRGFQIVELPESPGRYDGEFADLAKVIRGEKPLAWDASHDLAVHEAVLRASGCWENS